MYPLQIINDIKPLSLTLHCVNVSFIHHPSNVKSYSISHKLETIQPNQRKNVILSYIFLHLSANFGSKFKIPIATDRGQLFDIWAISTKWPTKWPSGHIFKNPK